MKTIDEVIHEGITTDRLPAKDYAELEWVKENTQDDNMTDKIKDVCDKIDKQLNINENDVILNDFEEIKKFFIIELTSYLHDNYLNMDLLNKWINTGYGDLFELESFQNIYEYFLRHMSKDKLLYFYASICDQLYTTKLDNKIGETPTWSIDYLELLLKLVEKCIENIRVL